MITLLIGKKGSGKTKKLIELANAAAQNSKGCVVVIGERASSLPTIFRTRRVWWTADACTALRECLVRTL